MVSRPASGQVIGLQLSRISEDPLAVWFSVADALRPPLLARSQLVTPTEDLRRRRGREVDPVKLIAVVLTGAVAFIVLLTLQAPAGAAVLLAVVTGAVTAALMHRRERS
jgi:Flp pilus assembly protein TadB